VWIKVSLLVRLLSSDGRILDSWQEHSKKIKILQEYFEKFSVVVS
jgi:hypothetical protein